VKAAQKSELETLLPINRGEIVQTVGNSGSLLTECLFDDRHAALPQGECLIVISQIYVNRREIAQQMGELRIILTENLFHDR
jgi:hypothetical protein